ncbi:MAG: SusF/SusE family outer membrane protein, partial [Flavobacteriaceae bacterium]|nr:SusF/SusE family outer membrane protein [Flavobacteriaceae bacterium]
SYTIEEWSWGVVGSGYNNWGDPNFPPDAKFYYDYTTDTFKVGVQLIDGEIKFRTNNDWSSGDDLGAAGTEGFLESPGSNIPVTAGHYLITVNFNTNEYSIVETDVWGVVGSGYNNWGNPDPVTDIVTPDFALTEIQENVLVGDVVTLIDGEVKFRTNNDWGSGDDLGAAATEGFLENPGSNIAVDAGLYRVRVDLNDNSYQLNKVQ